MEPNYYEIDFAAFQQGINSYLRFRNGGQTEDIF